MKTKVVIDPSYQHWHEVDPFVLESLNEYKTTPVTLGSFYQFDIREVDTEFGKMQVADKGIYMTYQQWGTPNQYMYHLVTANNISKMYTNPEFYPLDCKPLQGWEHKGFQCDTPKVFDTFVNALRTLNGWKLPVKKKEIIEIDTTQDLETIMRTVISAKLKASAEKIGFKEYDKEGTLQQLENDLEHGMGLDLLALVADVKQYIGAWEDETKINFIK